MLKPLKAIIADDEYLICDTLQEILHQLGIEVLDICHDGIDALHAISEFGPDIVFLDINMPGCSGIEVAKELCKADDAPVIVFISAYDDYALKAYEVNALDYILKPFVKEDIIKVMDKINGILTKAVKLNTTDAGGSNRDGMYQLPFCVYRGNRTDIIQADDIVYAYAENRGVFVQSLDGIVYSVRSTLTELEEKLDPRQFFRCHRNYLVNMRQAKELAPGFNRGYLLTLKGEKKVEIPVSRAKINQLSKYVHF